MAGVGACCWIDFTRHRGVANGQAMVLAGIVVLTPAFVFLATSTVMAECVFSAGALTGRARRRARDPSTTGAAWGGGACGCCVSGGCLDPDRRAWRRSRRPSHTWCCTGDGGSWRSARSRRRPACCRGKSTLRPTRRQRPTVIAHGGTIAYSYRELLQMARPGDVRVAVTPGEVAVRAARNVAGIATRDVGAIIAPAAVPGRARKRAGSGLRRIPRAWQHGRGHRDDRDFNAIECGHSGRHCPIGRLVFLARLAASPPPLR